MSKFFDTGKLLGIVFVAVGIILAVVIAPLVGNAGEQIYASLRYHCEYQGEKFTQLVDASKNPPTFTTIDAGGTADAACTFTDSAWASAAQTLRTPQSNTNNANFTASSGVITFTGSQVKVQPAIGRTLQGANDVLISLLTPAVVFAVLAGIGVNTFMRARGNSSEGMMSAFGQQLGGVLGVYVLGIVAPTIITNAGTWFASTQQLASAGLLRPIYGIVFDLVPMLVIFAMLALAAMPAWGGLARSGISRLRDRYNM